MNLNPDLLIHWFKLVGGIVCIINHNLKSRHCIPKFMSGQSYSSVHIEERFMLMITITEYLEKIFDEFKEHCDKGDERIESIQGLKDYSPRQKIL